MSRICTIRPVDSLMFCNAQGVLHTTQVGYFYIRVLSCQILITAPWYGCLRRNLHCQSSRILKNERFDLCLTNIHPITMYCWIKLVYLGWKLWHWGLWRLSYINLWMASTLNIWMTYFYQKVQIRLAWSLINRNKVLINKQPWSKMSCKGAITLCELKDSTKSWNGPKCSCAVCLHYTWIGP